MSEAPVRHSISISTMTVATNDAHRDRRRLASRTAASSDIENRTDRSDILESSYNGRYDVAIGLVRSGN